MTTQPTHTPTPWSESENTSDNVRPWHVVDGISKIIVDYRGHEMAIADDNYAAVEISKCVNAYAVLVDALKECREALRKTHEADTGTGYAWSILAMEKADAALALAEGK